MANLPDQRDQRESVSTDLNVAGTPAAVAVFPGDLFEAPATEPFAAKMDFRVELPTYRGPLDLLLYLVRKHELDVTSIPIALITDQYFEYLEVLEQLEVDSVGDFVEVASLLIEIKSRMVLPQVEDEDTEDVQDNPRDELVQRLLEYKAYKDAASVLSDSSHAWQQRYSRVANDLPPRVVDPADQPIQETELWDLVSAMGRIMRETERLKPVTNIVYDDTPIHVYMQSIHERLIRKEQVFFSSLFEAGMHKSKMIGIFLAILELARNYGVFVEQSNVHGEMELSAGPQFQPTWDLSESFSEFEGDEDVLVAPSKPR